MLMKSNLKREQALQLPFLKEIWRLREGEGSSKHHLYSITFSMPHFVLTQFHCVTTKRSCLAEWNAFCAGGIFLFPAASNLPLFVWKQFLFSKLSKYVADKTVNSFKITAQAISLTHLGFHLKLLHKHKLSHLHARIIILTCKEVLTTFEQFWWETIKSNWHIFQQVREFYCIIGSIWKYR